MSPSVVVCAHLDERALNLVRERLRGGKVQFVARDNPTEAERHLLAEADVIFGNVPLAILLTCRRLRWLQLESVGFEYYKSLASSPPSFVISNLKGMFACPAAETALAGLLALGRGLPQLLRAQQQTRWVELEVRPETWLLHGRSALILGAGSIGRRMRVLLEAFDCRVQVFARRNPAANLHTREQLQAAIPAHDLVVCCLPKTPETIGLVSRPLLEAMSPASIFVNIGRGAVVDEAALVDVLQRNRLRGAVIDVTESEPVPPHHPLWRCPNTIVTQHTAGGYADELVDKARCFLGNYERFRRDEPVLNIVNLQQGY